MRDTYQLCADFLKAFIDEMTALEVDLPATRYVAPGGTVAYDGEQVTVNVLRTFLGNPGGEQQYVQGDVLMMSVAMQVVIVRSTPGLTDGIGGSAIIPTATQIQNSAKEALADLTALTQALVNIKVKGTLCSPALPATVGPCTTQGPEGDVVATVGVFTMALL